MRLSSAVLALTASTALAAPVQHKLVARQLESLTGLLQNFIPFDISSYFGGGASSAPASPALEYAPPAPEYAPSLGPTGPSSPFGPSAPAAGPGGYGPPEAAAEPLNAGFAPAAPAPSGSFLSSLPFVGGLFQSFGLKFTDLPADGKFSDEQLALIKSHMTTENLEKIAATLRTLYTVAE